MIKSYKPSALVNPLNSVSGKISRSTRWFDIDSIKEFLSYFKNGKDRYLNDDDKCIVELTKSWVDGVTSRAERQGLSVEEYIDRLVKADAGEDPFRSIEVKEETKQVQMRFSALEFERLEQAPVGGLTPNAWVAEIVLRGIRLGHCDTVPLLDVRRGRRRSGQNPADPNPTLMTIVLPVEDARRLSAAAASRNIGAPGLAKSILVASMNKGLELDPPNQGEP